MGLILNIETATRVCSVALARDGKLLAVEESGDENYAHSEKLTTYIQNVFSQSKEDIRALDAVAVSKGPGSYTGLRIGVSTAKGICFALDKPLIAVETLMAMAYGVIASHSEGRDGTLFCPMLDARRMEVYCAVYDSGLNEVKKTAAVIVDENSFSDLLEKHRVVFFGDGADKCRQKLAHPNAVFIEGVFPSARFMLSFSESAFQKKSFEDVAYFEPFYLKDFISTGKK